MDTRREPSGNTNLNCAPLATTLLRRSSLANASATAKPAAQAKGLPPVTGQATLPYPLRIFTFKTCEWNRRTVCGRVVAGAEDVELLLAAHAADRNSAAQSLRTVMPANIYNLHTYIHTNILNFLWNSTMMMCLPGEDIWLDVKIFISPHLSCPPHTRLHLHTYIHTYAKRLLFCWHGLEASDPTRQTGEFLTSSMIMTAPVSSQIFRISAKNCLSPGRMPPSCKRSDTHHQPHEETEIQSSNHHDQ